MYVTQKILVIFEDEISALITLRPWLSDTAEWVCLTINAYNRCLNLRLSHVIFPSWLSATGTFSSTEYQLIEDRLIDLEASFVNLRQSLGFSDNSYWNHQHNITLLSILLSAKKTAQLAAKNLSKSTHYLIPLRQASSDYHFSGSLPSSILFDILKNEDFQIEPIFLNEKKLESVSLVDEYISIPNFWSSEISSAWQDSRSNTIISPCGLFYKPDQDKLKILTKKMGVTSLSWTLSPPFWSVMKNGDVFSEKITLNNAYNQLHSSIKSAVKIIFDNLLNNTNECFKNFLGQEISSLDSYKQQMQRIEQRHLYQILVFFGLTHLSSIKPMDGLILTVLDGGINGPLFSAATETGSPCYMLPHSRVINHKSENKCTIVTEYWQPKQALSLQGDINDIIYTDSSIDKIESEKLLNSKRPQKLVFLLNGIHRHTCINIAIDFLKETIKEVTNICSAAGFELELRLKPGDQTPLHAYSDFLDLNIETCINEAKKPLEQVLLNTQLVVSVDDPSSALWEAIERGCAVVLISNRDFIHSTLVDFKVITPFTPTDGCRLICELINNENKLFEFRKKQFEALNTYRKNRIHS